MLAVLLVLCALPLLCATLLLRVRIRAPTPAAADTALEELAPSYGVLFHEYRPGMCWWEAYMLLRRVLLLGVFVPLVSTDATSGLPRAQLALAVALAALLATQFAVRPYVHEMNNNMDAFTLTVLLLLVCVNAVALPVTVRALATAITLLVASTAVLAPLTVSLVLSAWTALRQRQLQKKQDDSELHESLLSVSETDL
jgi:hypothetical protein